MTPEQSMQVYLAECALHAEVLDEGLADVNKWMPLMGESSSRRIDGRLATCAPAC